MSEFDFPSFPQPAEDARALLSRLYREIGVQAIAAALDLQDAPDADRADDLRDALAALTSQARAA